MGECVHDGLHVGHERIEDRTGDPGVDVLGDRVATLMVHLSLTPNPSHLEAVNTVVLGKVRAKQQLRGDEDRKQVVGILLHGDAAFAGQGLVAETLDLSQLRGYRTGGTLHVITNNQIGFTTSPTKARSSPYSSDVAKMIQAPIFHVNGDDAETSIQVARIATEYRYRFKADVVIDMWGYRRAGHNESDEPAFTQPIMYKKIDAQPTTRAIYAKKLEDEGVIEAGGGDRMVEEFHAQLDTEFEAAKSYRPNKADWLEGRWADIGLAEAETALLRAHGILSASFGAEHPRTGKTAEFIVEMYEAWNRPDEATKYRAPAGDD